MRAAGTYEALFLKGSSETTRTVNETLGELMKCPVCHALIRLRKKTAPMFFVTENLECDGDVPGNVETLKKGWRCFP